MKNEENNIPIVSIDISLEMLTAVTYDIFLKRS